ncbi:hypothetical protein [Lapillicoccus jejuensis]|uniref:Uncharacterized protein n=1 Tax=Lapillicoccus jejuensis TaxID=402171 RepID=A0A542E4W8_9MICO|nr:hypothetical protein [Lapillicoccus jejuensis]TQJ10392.1 hypothetical protein FB458_3513 [Lapillicoccus jejuensis]
MPLRRAARRAALPTAVLAFLALAVPTASASVAGSPVPPGTVLTAPAGTAPQAGDAAVAARRELAGSAAAAAAAQASVRGAGAVRPTDALTGGTAAAQPAVPSVEAVASRRVLDTRTTTGPTSGKPLAAGASLSVPVLGAGVPAAGVTAVLVNLTVVGGSTTGWVRLDDGTAATTSTVNVEPGQAVSNQALVPVRDGAVRVTNGGGRSAVHVVLDVQGWVGAGAALTAVAPTRVLDTRRGTVRPVAGSTTTYTLPVPPGTTGVVANLTAVPVPGAGPGYLTAYRAGTPRPSVSHVNTTGGRPVATLAVLPVDAAGRVSVLDAGGPSDVVVDVEGYLTSGDTATRVYDSRRASTGPLPLTRGEVRRVPVAGVAGVPTGTGAVLAHLTVTAPTTSGYLTGWAWGADRPATSSVNFPAGATVTNTVLLPLAPDGSLALASTAASSDVVVDIQAALPRPALVVTPPSRVPTYGPSAPADTAMARRSLLDADRYAMGTWWQTVAPGLLAAPAGRTMVTTGTSPTVDPVRRLSMTALALSTSLATGAYDESSVGVPAAVARQRLVTILRRVTTTHAATTPDGWGDSWQSTLWSGIAGRAAWLSWGSLPVDVQSATARMVEHEARYATTLPVTYYRGADGTLLSPGNTFAEELSWRMLPLQVALVMLPGHPDVPVWANTQVRLALASWARPSDVGSTQQVAGAPLGAWVTGSNVEQDGTVVNHARIAPDYSTTIYQDVDGVLLDAVAGRPAPRALTLLLRPVYDSYTTRRFSPTVFAAPGGPVYADGGGIYYPQGNDWGTGQLLPYALVDAQAQAFLGEDTAAVLQQHLAGHQALTDRFTDGRTYSLTPSPQEYVYIGREEHTAQLAAQLVLTQLVRDSGTARTSDASAWLG